MAKTYNTFTNVSAGSVLTASDYNDLLENTLNYRVPPLCAATMTGSHTSTGNWQVISWATQEIDTDDIFAPTSSLFTIKTAGVYLITLAVGYTSNATGVRAAQVRKNAAGAVGSGTRISGPYWETAAPSGSALNLTGSGIASLAVNDTVEAFGFQSSGGSLAYQNMHFSVAWLGQVS